MEPITLLNSVRDVNVSGSNPTLLTKGKIETREIAGFQEAMAQARATDRSAPVENIDVAKQFETMVLSQLIAQVFHEQPDGAFGEGMQGDFYKSVFSEAIAEQMVKGGGIGIGEMLEAGSSLRRE